MNGLYPIFSLSVKSALIFTLIEVIIILDLTQEDALWSVK